MLLTDGGDLLHSNGLRPCSAFHTKALLCLCHMVSSSHTFFQRTEPRVGDVIQLWSQNKLVITPGTEHHHPAPIL